WRTTVERARNSAAVLAVYETSVSDGEWRICLPVKPRFVVGGAVERSRGNCQCSVAARHRIVWGFAVGIIERGDNAGVSDRAGGIRNRGIAGSDIIAILNPGQSACQPWVCSTVSAGFAVGGDRQRGLGYCENAKV